MRRLLQRLNRSRTWVLISKTATKLNMWRSVFLNLWRLKAWQPCAGCGLILDTTSDQAHWLEIEEGKFWVVDKWCKQAIMARMKGRQGGRRIRRA